MNDPAPSRLQRFWPVAILALVTFGTFFPALRGAFLNWDDDRNFLDNPDYRGLGPTQLRWMFSTFLMGHYHPLTWITLGADYVVWGMHPFGYHLTSLLIHTVNAVLIYFVLQSLLRLASGPGPAWPSLIGALFYAIHPLRVESVAWITERRDVVCGFFSLTCVLAYLKRAEEERAGRPATRWYLLSIAAFGASLLSKALSLPLPAILILLDFYPLGRLGPETRRRALLEKIPFVLLSFADAAIMFFAMRHIDAVQSVAGYDFAQRAAQAAYGLCFYLVKSLVPVGLSPLVGLPAVFNPWSPINLVSFAAVAAAFGWLAMYAKRRPWALTAGLGYAALIFPVLGLLVTGGQLVADRYSYLALMPASALLAGGLRGGALSRPTWRLRELSTLVLAGLSVLTFLQCRVWKDSLALWDQVIACDPNLYLARNNRGTARMLAGDREGALQDYDASISLNPNWPKPWYNRGVLRAAQGDHAAAVSDFSVALRLAPENAEALAARAFSRGRVGDSAGAESDFEQALKFQPRSATVWSYRGILQFERGEFQKAAAAYTKALEFEPCSAEILKNRGQAQFSSGRYREAMEDYTRSLEYRPQHVETRIARGTARALANDPQGALADFSEALRIQPDPAILLRRGTLRGMLGDLDGAIADSTEAIRLKPDYADAYLRRGVALMEKKADPAQAALDFSRALELAPADSPQRRQIEQVVEAYRSRR